MKFVWQSLLLVFSFSFVFAWQISPLSNYTIQLLAVFIVLFLLTSIRKNGFSLGKKLENDGALSIFLINTAILLLIFTTGGLNSNLVFLLYFLGFGIAFVFEPAIVFVFMLGAILVFLPSALRDDVFGNLVRLGSLLLICPIAFFFGMQSRKQEEQERKEEATKTTLQKISKQAEEILEDKTSLPESEVKNLTDIVKESKAITK